MLAVNDECPHCVCADLGELGLGGASFDVGHASLVHIKVSDRVVPHVRAAWSLWTEEGPVGAEFVVETSAAVPEDANSPLFVCVAPRQLNPAFPGFSDSGWLGTIRVTFG